MQTCKGINLRPINDLRICEYFVDADFKVNYSTENSEDTKSVIFKIKYSIKNARCTII